MSSKSRIEIIDSVEYQPNFDLLKELEKKSIIPKQISDLKNEVITFIEQEFNEFLAVTKLKVQIQILHQKQKKASLKLEETRKQVEQQTKATQILEKKISLRSNLYELYKNNLGFEIKPLKGGMNEEQSEIAFSFNHIDKDNPLETYSFILVLNEKTYSVKNCTPSLTEMERLLTELNKTNDLSSFVIQVRRNFMSLLTN
ncbi:uncharacterized protein TNIN_131021 [Trichonephila inaurata madagascariensis]|uniref:Kinetochore protein SPC25 n=1 Tax=Trichonephila inaurata madagascariensis TaxID=2747483 RepID=A0A8X6XYD1_9ARAC|nr:uncharacterized protein TNIN_131021 [Trichonephila inaurata madagascariensis]